MKKSTQPLTVAISVIAPHHYVFIQTSDVPFIPIRLSHSLASHVMFLRCCSRTKPRLLRKRRDVSVSDTSRDAPPEGDDVWDTAVGLKYFLDIKCFSFHSFSLSFFIFSFWKSVFLNLLNPKSERCVFILTLDGKSQPANLF